MTIYLATGNAHKVVEFRAILRDLLPGVALEIGGADALGGMPEVDESAGTFSGNARLKAEALRDRLPSGDTWSVADDSGLQVDALGGEPGVYSSRFAGPDASDGENLRKVLAALGDSTKTPRDARTGRFVCAISMVNAAGQWQEFKGTCEGHLIDAPRGQGGFGYDPIFVPEGYAQTFAELGADVKNRLSHRANALTALASWIRSR